MKLAKRERMDLLPVAPHAKPPVFRLGDANEAAKQARLRERDMRKKEMENRRKTLMKEVRRKACYVHGHNSGCMLLCRLPSAVYTQQAATSVGSLMPGRLHSFSD